MRSDGRLFLKIDESGSPGKKTKYQTHYVMAGCLVADTDAFEGITERYHSKTELKFYTNPELREEILRDAEPLVEAVYFVQYSKGKHGWDGSGDKRALHRSMLYSLVRGIANDGCAERIDVVIDHNKLIPDEEARALAHEICEKAGIRANVMVGDSAYDYGLQTNDFFVGAVGYNYNTPREPNSRGNKYFGIFAGKAIEIPFREFRGRIAVKNGNRRKPGTPPLAETRATQTSYGPGTPALRAGRLNSKSARDSRYLKRPREGWNSGFPGRIATAQTRRKLFRRRSPR